MPVPEAPLHPARGHGVEPKSDGWYVLNAADAHWVDGAFGTYTRLGGTRELWPLVGINIAVLQPGQPACMYHGEDEQEDFLVIQGECLLLIEGEERRLRAGDFVHCPPATAHIFVGAGDGPCAIFMVGGRTRAEVLVYPRSEVALRHGAGVETETRDPDAAYAPFGEWQHDGDGLDRRRWQ